MNNSLNVLVDSLEMKLEVLDRLKEYTDRQKSILESDNPDAEEFDKLVTEKDAYVDKLIALDDGFEKVYADVAEELKLNRASYAGQIRQLQDKISRLTEISASIQAQEARNKKLMEDFLSKQRQGIRQNRISSKAAYDYYRNMSGMNLQMPGFMDSKN